MRLDKFLKVSRVVKRRTLAKELCDGGRVQVNGKVAKAGTEVIVGDALELRFGQRAFVVRIEKIQETTRKDAAAEMYTILRDDRIPGSSSSEQADDDLDE